MPTPFKLKGQLAHPDVDAMAKPVEGIAKLSQSILQVAFVIHYN